jgi:hypothetical protein
VDWRVLASREPWTSATVQQLVERRVPWLVDLMIFYITNVLANANFVAYVGKLCVREQRLSDTVTPRVVGPVGDVQGRCFLLQFSPGNECAVIWVAGDTIEVFDPFPSKEQHRPLLAAACDLLERNYLPQKHYGRLLYELPQWHESNLWVPYFVVLRVLYNNVGWLRQVLATSELRGQLGNRALLTLNRVSQEIQDCARRDKRLAAEFEDVLDLREESRLEPVLLLLRNCPKGDITWIRALDLTPQAQSPTSWSADVGSQWRAFVPVAGATLPVFYF